MKFCDICDNMLYIDFQEDKDNTTKKILLYTCKVCNTTVEEKTSGSILVIDDNKINDEIKYSQYINKYLKYDPCLPRVNNIICTNSSCTKPADKDNEVIYLKYDPINMKYIYHCCYCNHFWNNE